MLHPPGGGGGCGGFWALGYNRLGTIPGYGDLPHGEQDYVYAVWAAYLDVALPPSGASPPVGYAVDMYSSSGTGWIVVLTWDGVTPEAECAYWLDASAGSQQGILVHLIPNSAWYGSHCEGG